MDDLDLAIRRNRTANVAGLRRNHSRKPAYDERLKLIQGECWLSPTRMITDADGKLIFKGFLGEYGLSTGH